VDFLGRPWGDFAACQFQRQFRVQTVKLEFSATVSCRNCQHVPRWRQFHGESVTAYWRQFHGESVTGWRPDDSFGPKLSTTRRRLTGSLRHCFSGATYPRFGGASRFGRQFHGETVKRGRQRARSSQMGVDSFVVKLSRGFVDSFVPKLSGTPPRGPVAAARPQAPRRAREALPWACCVRGRPCVQ
jgi:hypothetical protein